MKMLVLGCGNMSSAIIEGMNGEIDFSQSYFYTPSVTRAQELASKVKGKLAKTLEDLPNDPKIVFIACKPQQFSELAGKLKDRFTSNPVYISILAATPVSLHEKLLNTKKVIRVMPNMPVRFKKGVSILISSADIPGPQKSQWEKNFALIGKTMWAKNENEFNELMLLTGSGPAFMYQWLLWLSDMSSNVSKTDQESLAISVLEGALASIKNDPNKSLKTLISEVTSKGGVTAAVLNGWEDESVSSALKNGWKKGLERTSEIEEIILKSV